MAPTHRFFDHTGDFGVDLEGDSFEELLAALSVAFLDLLTGAPESVAPSEARALEARGFDEVDLLVGLGNELLFRFEMGFLVRRLEGCEVFEREASLDEAGGLILRAQAWGEAYDPERHPIARPIKAVTHHAAALSEGPEGARGRLIFDL